MTKMIDSVRVLLKAYGEELTLDQIKMILAGKTQTLLKEVEDAIPELIASKLIIETKPGTYKIADSARPNFFYVFQNSTYMPELTSSCIFCPYSPEGRTISNWETINEVTKGDIIFHDCGGSICAISEALGGVQDEDRPYTLKNSDVIHGRVVNTMYTVLRKQLDRSQHVDVMKELVTYQPAKTAPFEYTGRGHEGYLFFFNDKCSKIVIDTILNSR